MFSANDKIYILNLARQAIVNYFASAQFLKINANEVPGSLRAKQSCFVTLNIAGELRGCIGHTEPIQPLYKDIIENATGAAFADPRFSPLLEDEFQHMEIEVSILTLPQELKFSGPKDLLNKLRPGIDGVMIKRGRRGATYLPQIWQELSDKKEFLSSLCLKAGLLADDWQKSELEVFVYQAEVIK